MRESITQLRSLIIELGLIWLDEELDDLISTGNIISDEINGSLELVAFTDEQELQIIISALRKYFVELPVIYNETLSSLRRTLNIRHITFKSTEESTFELETNSQTLNSLLNQVQ